MNKEKVGNINMFLCYSKITIKSWFQYRIDALLRSLAVFCREAVNVTAIYITLLTFGNINGWNTYELLYLYSIIFLTYGMLILFFTGLRDFERMVQEGTFDRFILRPRGLLFQVISSNADWFAAIGHGGLGLFLFLYSAQKVNIVWNIHNIIYYIVIIIGGVLIQGAIFLFFASCSFYFVKTSNMRELCYWNMRKFAGYPISVFPKLIQGILIYIIPFAFVNYFPVQYSLRKADMAYYNEMFVYLNPLVGSAMMGLAYFYWLYSIRHYSSTGN